MIANELKSDSRMTLFHYMEKQITHLTSRGQLRTAETYRSTLNSFFSFYQKMDVCLEELNVELLSDYAYYLRSRGIRPNTIVFYLKRLKAVYHKAVEDELTEDHHPFRKVSLSSEKTVKRAISLKYIRRLKGMDLSSSPSKQFARDMFLFSFYTRGMSFVDMAHLQKQNLQGEFLTYRRQKTGQLLTLYWEPCMARIASKYSSKSSSPYLLSVIRQPNGDVRQQCHNALTLINRHLKEIGRKLYLPLPLTMYVARHSWASIAREEGIPLSVISEGLGHESEKTTRIYLASLETQVIDKANKKILEKL